MRTTIVIIILIAFSLAGCSTRQVYEPISSVSSSPDAIDINTATAEELDKLPHIGHKTAEAIIRFREENGPFRRPEYLMQIRGMSEKRFAELRPFVKTE